MKIRGISPVDSGCRYRKENTKPYSIHFSNVFPMEGEAGGMIIYLRLRKNNHKDNDKTKLLGH